MCIRNELLRSISVKKVIIDTLDLTQTIMQQYVLPEKLQFIN